MPVRWPIGGGTLVEGTLPTRAPEERLHGRDVGSIACVLQATEVERPLARPGPGSAMLAIAASTATAPASCFSHINVPLPPLENGLTPFHPTSFPGAQTS